MGGRSGQGQKEKASRPRRDPSGAKGTSRYHTGVGSQGFQRAGEKESSGVGDKERRETCMEWVSKKAQSSVRLTSEDPGKKSS